MNATKTHKCTCCGQSVDLENLNPQSLEPGDDAEYGETWTVRHTGCEAREQGDQVPEGDDPAEAWVVQI